MSPTFERLAQPFIEQRPICVMARAILEKFLHPARVDAVFERAAKTQYTRELLFSSVVDLMSQVVLGTQPSIHAAYQALAEKLGVSDQAVYDKLNHAEPAVAAELVRDSARQATALIRALRAPLAAPLNGYRTKILDGNHLSATEHRLDVLRKTWAAPLPGTVLVVLDPALMLVDEVIPCEDGHASERSLIQLVLAMIEPADLWLGDRNFCTTNLMAGIDQHKAAFVIRQHGGLKGELFGPRRHCGNSADGTLHEQSIRITDDEDRSLTLRRITLRLKRNTRDGDREIHLLTNLPADVADAAKVAELYAERWTIELMFQELSTTLDCEIKTLGYPRAALLGFCLALVAYHAVSVVKAALRAAHGSESVERDVSAYYLSLELKQAYDGMMVAVPASHWKWVRRESSAALATFLERLAAGANLARYRKHPRGPKRPAPKKSRYRNGGHVSTARLLRGHGSRSPTARPGTRRSKRATAP